MSQPTQRQEQGAGSSEPMDLVIDEAPDEPQTHRSRRSEERSGEPTWQFLKQGYDWTGGSLQTKGYRTDFDSVRIPTSPARVPSPQTPMRPVDRKMDWRHPDHLGVVAEFVSSLNSPAPPAAAAALQIPKAIPKPERTGWRWLGWALAASSLLALAGVALRDHGNAVQTVPTIAAVAPASPAPPEPANDSSAPSELPSLAPPENLVPQPATTETAAATDATPVAVLSPASGSAPAVPAARSRIELEVSEILVSSRAVAAVVILKRTGSTSGPARVRWKTVPGTATPGTDYESVSAIVKFADGQATRTLYVPILQPPARTEPRSFSIKLQRLGKGPALGSNKSTTVTIWGDA